jgi:pimeloyl-ACP methyl ester carboxylesterase
MRRLAVLAMLATGCLADRLLLWPPSEKASFGELREMVEDADGKFEIFVAHGSPGNEPDGYVLCFFGNAQLADSGAAVIAEAVAPLHLEVWGVNYPGFGGTPGDATLDGVARVARRSYAAIAKRAGDKPILVFGSSMGATAALHVTAHERVDGVVLHNPPPLRELILRRHGWWNLWLLALPVAADIPDALDAIENARHSYAPAVFLSSGDDGVVPVRYQQRVMMAYAGDWTLLEAPNAGHNDPLPAWILEELSRTLARWILQG